MDNLITKTDFTGLTSLAGMSETYNSNSLDSYIALYQEEILKGALGESLYNLLDENYDTGTDDKWKKLVEGDTYILQRDGKDFTIKYKGVKELLTFLIYYYYKSELASQSTTTGEVVANNENSVPAKVDTKVVKSHNLGVELYNDLICYSEVEFVDVGDFPFFPGSTSSDIYKANLFNYITYQNGEDETTYPNWIFKALTKINQFGI